jgi:hypothetical protein
MPAFGRDAVAAFEAYLKSIQLKVDFSETGAPAGNHLRGLLVTGRKNGNGFL